MLVVVMSSEFLEVECENWVLDRGATGRWGYEVVSIDLPVFRVLQATDTIGGH